MKLFNFGSLNVDHVYSVDEFVQPGQTIHAKNYQQFFGGKGLNQSIAAAHAGMQVMHVGQVGAGGKPLIDQLSDCQVDVTLIDQVNDPTGHAIIQVADSGENEIIVFGGANQTLTKEKIDTALTQANEGDWVLCQNETNHVDYLINQASQARLLIALNPAPMTDAVTSYPLDSLDLLIVNETEGAALTGQSDVKMIVDHLLKRYPQTHVLLTLGEKGAIYASRSFVATAAAEKVTAVDTTAAGDTFIGYFLAGYTRGKDIESCLKTACQAAALSVQKAGAASSIPHRSMLT